MATRASAPQVVLTKTLVCIHPFGHFLPGDEIDVPGDAIFDTAYFAVKVKEADTE